MIVSKSPIDGSMIGEVPETSPSEINYICELAQNAFLEWREIPAPKRGEFVRIWGEVLRDQKQKIAEMVTLEAGKTRSEALGEVQEMIDMCDFACGLSRQIYGLTIASERPEHHLIERYKPLGVVGIISAFNFPVAVFAWNAALALICGNSIVWKPSEKTAICAKLVLESLETAAFMFGGVPMGLFSCLFGAKSQGEILASHPNLRLISATGSTRMGREVAQLCAGSFKRTLFELGGNGAMIVRESADLDLAIRAIVFAATGTSGQRCTTLRRLIIAPKIKTELVSRLIKAYSSLKIGDPRNENTHLGPLIDEMAWQNMQNAILQAQAEGGKLLYGGERIDPKNGAYVTPAIIEMPQASEITKTETFAPILYIIEAETLNDAIVINNNVPQGLSSAIFTNDLREAETFLSVIGSDCGIANVNIGTSGAEIGGAFGGEKETGGGREAGSDAWKAYMVRQTQTINYSKTLPLAQGVKFEI